MAKVVSLDRRVVSISMAPPPVMVPAKTTDAAETFAGVARASRNLVIGEFTMAALLNRPAFGPYMQLLGANRAYEPAALAVIAFAATWGCMGLMQLISRLLGVRKTAK